MFTGIVQRLGHIVDISMDGTVVRPGSPQADRPSSPQVDRPSSPQAGRITMEPNRPFDRPVGLGDSIAVNGTCLTVAEMDGDKLMFDVLGETFDKTNLGDKKPGDVVNLEQALALGDTLGGHIVTGHVDNTGTVAKIEQVGRDWKFTIETSRDMLMLMVYKGSIAIDGISLTVAELTDNGFIVHIIPHTIQETDMSEFKVGTKVNLEADILGKHVQRILEFGGGQDYRLNLTGQ